MKPLFLPAILALAFLSFSFKSAPVQPKSLGEVIYTVPLDKTPALRTYRAEWWHQYAEYDVNEAFFAPLIKKLKEGSVTVYKPVYPYDQPMTQQELMSILERHDSLQVFDDNMEYEVTTLVVDPLEASEITGVTFREEWFYDAASLTLKKVVKGIILNHTGYENTDEPLFYIPFSATGSAGASSLTIAGLTYDLFPDEIPDSTAQQHAGAMKQQLLTTMAMTAGNKKVKCYDTLYPYNRLLSKKEKPVRCAQLGKADQLRFLEDWQIDLQQMHFEKTVKGVVFVRTGTVKTGWGEEAVDYRIAFLPLNGYVPVLAGPSGKVTVKEFDHNAFFRQTENPALDRLSGDTAKLSAFAGKLADLAHSGKLPVYRSTGEGDPAVAGEKPLSSADIENIFVSVDSVELPDPKNPDEFSMQVEVTHLDYNNICGFQFYESWSIDPSGLQFAKNTTGIGVFYYQTFYNADLAYPKNIFVVHLQPVTDPNAIMKPDYLVGRHLRTTFPINSQEQDGYDNDYGDIVIPYAQNTFATMPPSQRYQVMQQVVDLAIAGKIVVYDGADTTKVLTPAQFLEKMDTLNQNLEWCDVSNEFLALNELSFDEDWYFNPATGQFYKKVNSVTFIYRAKDTYDENEKTIHHETPVFTVKMK